MDVDGWSDVGWWFSGRLWWISGSCFCDWPCFLKMKMCGMLCSIYIYRKQKVSMIFPWAKQKRISTVCWFSGDYSWFAGTSLPLKPSAMIFATLHCERCRGRSMGNLHHQHSSVRLGSLCLLSFKKTSKLAMFQANEPRFKDTKRNFQHHSLTSQLQQFPFYIFSTYSLHFQRRNPTLSVPRLRIFSHFVVQAALGSHGSRVSSGPPTGDFGGAACAATGGGAVALGRRDPKSWI